MTDTFTHTPWPWEACDPGDYSDFDGQSVVILGDDRRIAVVQGDSEEAVANARLIASAPAMLEALINAERALSDYACRDPDDKGAPCIRTSGQCAAECGEVASIALGWTRVAIALATGETK